MDECWRRDHSTLASHAGVFRGARLSFVGRDGIPAPLKTPAWEANSTLDFRRSLGCGVGLFAGGGSQRAITCDQTVLLPLPLSFFPLRLGEEKVRTPDPRERRKSIQGLTRKRLVQNRGCVNEWSSSTNVRRGEGGVGIDKAKMTRMFVVLLRGRKCRFRLHLRCSSLCADPPSPEKCKRA